MTTYSNISPDAYKIGEHLTRNAINSRQVGFSHLWVKSVAQTMCANCEFNVNGYCSGGWCYEYILTEGEPE